MSGPRVTVIAGLDRQSTDDVASGVLLARSRSAAVWADPFPAEFGYVQTTVADGDGRCLQATVPLEHDCVTCTLRAGIAAAVRDAAGSGRYDTVLLPLHPGLDTGHEVVALGRQLAGIATVSGVVTVLRAGWLARLAGSETVEAAGIGAVPRDDRRVADLLAAQLDAATLLVLPDERGVMADVAEQAALAVLAPGIERLSPLSPLDVDVARLLRHPRRRRLGSDRFAARGLLDPRLQLPAPSAGLAVVRWSSRRPLHPTRLQAALQLLAPRVVRSTGYIWLATRPDVAGAWDSAGDQLHLSAEQRWPALMAAGNRLGFLGERLDATTMRTALDACRLTDAEMAGGPAAWLQWDDPFPPWTAPSPGAYRLPRAWRTLHGHSHRS